MHEWLIATFGPGRVESEAPSDVAKEDNWRNEPQADFKLLKERSDQYSSNPQPEDILLAIEISDTTVRFDLKVKAKLYARAGMVEYWVVNIPDRQLVVHREPRDGVYKSIVAYERNEEVSPLAAPEARICLDRL